MFTLFRRQKVFEKEPRPAAAPADGLLQPESAATLLATPRRQKLLEHIWQRTSLSRSQFAKLYQAPVERYAALVQHFPASEHHHHAYHGGMLDHALESVAYGLKMRQSHLLPVGAAPELQAAQSEVWTAGIAYAALVHDIGKIAVDLQVQYADDSQWHPWHGPLQGPYRFRYRQDRIYRLHGAASGLLYTAILGNAILDWVHGYPELWSSLLFVLAGQHEHAGILGELVIQADRASVAQQLGGNPQTVREAPSQSLQRKLLDGLRFLIREKWKLNQAEASDGWLTEDALWLVSKNACDKLRAHLLSHGVEGIPSNNPAVFNILQEHGIVQPTADGKAIWRATVTTPKGWEQTLSFLKLSPALFWGSDDRPAAFEGNVRVSEEGREPDSPATQDATASYVAPTSTSGLVRDQGSEKSATADALDLALNVLGESRDPGETQSERASSPSLVAGNPVSRGDDAVSQTAEPADPEQNAGRRFVNWLRNAVDRRTLKINDQKALVHSVDGTAYLLSPGVFQRYMLEHPELARRAALEGIPDWRWIQRHFERLRIHRKHTNGHNIWTCEVSGPRKIRRVHGYLLQDSTQVFAALPPDNPYLKLLEDGEQADTDAA
jgi:integrating conjugative element relaxase (TIGR03760 family)